MLLACIDATSPAQASSAMSYIRLVAQVMSCTALFWRLGARSRPCRLPASAGATTWRGSTKVQGVAAHVPSPAPMLIYVLAQLMKYEEAAARMAAARVILRGSLLTTPKYVSTDR